MAVFTNVKKEDLEKIKSFSKDTPKTVHEELRLKKGNVALVLYYSGKLLLQGKKEEVAKIAKELEKLDFQLEKAEAFRNESGWIIGSDEALKGDTFGGITVAAVKADDKLRKKLQELGVQDSKKLSDHEILRIADEIRKIVPCEIKSIFPEEYNQHKGKVTLLLNRLHQEAGQYLKPGKHIVDKYPGCNAGDIQTEHAESKYVEVAAASILARDAALKQLNSLSILAGFHLPKGSTHVKLALMELKHRKLDFTKFVKIDFYNVKEFLEE